MAVWQSHVFRWVRRREGEVVRYKRLASGKEGVEFPLRPTKKAFLREEGQKLSNELKKNTGGTESLRKGQL